jgi:transcriptional regulator with XRE-family HTH domain
MGNIGDKNTSTNPVLVRHSLYRGVFSRVAKELGIDRSYVSRVASGERKSEKVEAALLKEIERIEKLTGGNSSSPKKYPKKK